MGNRIKTKKSSSVNKNEYKKGKTKMWTEMVDII